MNLFNNDFEFFFAIKYFTNLSLNLFYNEFKFFTMKYFINLLSIFLQWIFKYL